MSEINDLYQEMILDHCKNPRNHCRLDCATHHAEGRNPLCGDHVDVYAHVKDGRIEDISFEGSGCAISKASASLMTAQLKGKTVEEADALFEKMHRMLTGEANNAEELEQLGKLAALSGVCEYPVRVKCATLAWHTLRSALEEANEVASSE